MYAFPRSGVLSVSASLFSCLVSSLLVVLSLTVPTSAQEQVALHPALSSSLPFSGTLNIADTGGSYYSTGNPSALGQNSTGTTIEFWVNIPASYYGQTTVVTKPQVYDVVLGMLDGALFFIVNQEGINVDYLRESPGWHHIAYAYQDDGTRYGKWYYVDGFLRFASGNDSKATPTSSKPFNVSRGTPLELDELRVSNVLRYPQSSDFTPPTEPFICDQNVMALWHFDAPNSPSQYAEDCEHGLTLTRVYEIYGSFVKP